MLGRLSEGTRGNIYKGERRKVSSDSRFYALSVIFTVLLALVFIGIEFFSLSMFVVSFIVFGVPVIVTSAVFWYDLLDSLLSP